MQVLWTYNTMVQGETQDHGCCKPMTHTSLVDIYYFRGLYKQQTCNVDSYGQRGSLKLSYGLIPPCSTTKVIMEISHMHRFSDSKSDTHLL